MAERLYDWTEDDVSLSALTAELLSISKALHGFVEKNLAETALKLLRYNLPWTIGELTERKGRSRQFS